MVALVVGSGVAMTSLAIWRGLEMMDGLVMWISGAEGSGSVAMGVAEKTGSRSHC